MHEFRSAVPGLCDPPEPYSYSVRAGQTIYLAGQVALDADMQIVGSTVAEQAAKVWRNIESVLAASGATLADIVKITYYVQDIRELSGEIDVRKTLFAPGDVVRPDDRTVQSVGSAGDQRAVRVRRRRATHRPPDRDLSRRRQAGAADRRRVRARNVPIRSASTRIRIAFCRRGALAHTWNDTTPPSRTAPSNRP